MAVSKETKYKLFSLLVGLMTPPFALLAAVVAVIFVVGASAKIIYDLWAL